MSVWLLHACVTGMESAYKYVEKGQRLIPIDLAQVCIQHPREMVTPVGNQLAQMHNKSYCPQSLIAAGLAEQLERNKKIYF